MKDGAERVRVRASGGDRVVVSVSLARYYADARALSYMSVPRRRRACWLAARLARRWRLPAPGPALLLRGHLLPPAERLRVLAPGDTLQVIPQGDNWFLDEDDLTSSSEDEAPVQKRQTSEPPIPLWHNNEVKDGNRPQKETPDGVVIEDASSTSSVVTRSDAADHLRALKRRALALLDHCAPEPEPEPSPTPCTSPRPADVTDGVDAGVFVARQRRRRVRRRVRRVPPDPEAPALPPPPPPPTPPPGEQERDADTRDSAAAAAAAGPAPPGAGAVLMNGAQRGDARPRLVRPLH